jgi:hypothetical protein
MSEEEFWYAFLGLGIILVLIRYIRDRDFYRDF